MVVADAHGLPLALCAQSAQPAEVKLVKETLKCCPRGMKPKWLIGDKAYDSDPFDIKLKIKKMKMIAPHKSNRKKAATQDVRELRRYKRKWKVEPFNAWLRNFRRIVVRWDFYQENDTAFLYLAAFLILWKYL